MSWNPTSAGAVLMSKGWEEHKVLARSAHYSCAGMSREVMVPRDRETMVTCYVNAFSETGIPFPALGIDGIEVRARYKPGHAGKNGNPGIAASVVRHSPSLDPQSNHVLLVWVRDDSSLLRLLDWYRL